LFTQVEQAPGLAKSTCGNAALVLAIPARHLFAAFQRSASAGSRLTRSSTSLDHTQTTLHYRNILTLPAPAYQPCDDAVAARGC
jgi:hypothetical protein